MNWLTLKQIKQAAKTSDKAALECSRLHWEQLAKWQPKALEKACVEGLISIHGGFCANCVRHSAKCPECILATNDTGSWKCCNGLWEAAWRAYNLWKGNPTPATYKAFRDAAKAVDQYIATKIEEME